MKSILYAFVLFLFFSNTAHAGSSYTVSSNTNWNGVYPSYCNTCTFTISSGVTLTLNTSATCYNCTIIGGSVTLTSDFTFQQSAFNNTTINISGNTLNLQNNGTSFTNVVVNASGASNFYPTGSLSISGSTFNFSGSAAFNNAGGQLDITNSHLYFVGSADFNATAGPVNLNTSSQIVAGDGSSLSNAYILVNGPTLNLVDAGSGVYVANTNNYYANWNSYKSLSNSKTYTTAGNNKNCGGSGQNACSAQKYYGCATFTNVGPVTCTTLASLFNYIGSARSGDDIRLNWSVGEGAEISYFQVERSVDGIYFQSIGNMEPAYSETAYSYIDNNPAPGLNYYRVALVTRDGKTDYSKVVIVQTDPVNKPRLYPNPITGDLLNVEMPSNKPATLSIYSLDGRCLSTHTLSGQLRYQISLPEVNKVHMFVVRISTGETSNTFSVLNN